VSEGDPREVLEGLVPAWSGREDVGIDPLPGGWTNQNYRVQVGTETFALRVSGPHARILAIDREREHKIAARAHAAGLGPELVAADPERGHLLTRFVDGRTLPWDRAPSRDDALRMVEALRRIHALEPVPGSYDAFRMIEHLLGETRRAGGALPSDHARLLRALRDAERGYRRLPARACLCHNDLSLGNFVFPADGELCVLDWESAAIGDPFFDLATLAVGHLHDTHGRRTLLEAYTGGARAEDLRRLDALELAYELREASWSLLMWTRSGGAGPLAREFQGAADRFFAAARRRCADR
jgi:thiamine kinase-like enzyme